MLTSEGRVWFIANVSHMEMDKKSVTYQRVEGEHFASDKKNVRKM